jgi:DNA polymerase bacteriophage-type
MIASQRYMVFDYETFSETNLKKTGAFEYSVHPSTEVLCVAFRAGTKETLDKAPTLVWAPHLKNYFGDFVRELLNKDTILVAHNAYFENVITKNVFARRYCTQLMQREIAKIPQSRWLCTASLSAALALPRHLAGAGQALGLDTQKDQEGHRLMLKWCKPRKPTKKNPSTRCSDPAEYRRLIDYCVTDLESEVELFRKLPPLHPAERRLWLLDQKINLRGFHVDREMVTAVLRMIDEEKVSLDDETDSISLGLLTSAIKRGGTLNWLGTERIHLPDLQAKTVANAIDTGYVNRAKVTADAKRVLEIRQAIAKTSTAKYTAFEMRSRFDARVRDTLLYHGASTGRWSGVGIQPQNFPRGAIKDTATAAEILRESDLDTVRLIYGYPMDAFSSCLRAVITAPEGRELFCADYSAIEARVLFWVAKHEDGLAAFRNNRPIYEEMAGTIYRKKLSDIKPDERQLGKQAILGCGFGMGHKKFHATCLKYDMDVSGDLAKQAVKAYRDMHRPVVKLWGKLENAAIMAAQNHGKRYTINRTTWFVRGRFLYCELPSGRRLAYYGPEVKYEPDRFEQDVERPVLYHWGVNPVTRQWEKSSTYGGRLVENTIQAIARDFMAAAMLRLEDAGYEIVLSVHDELVAERDLGEGDLAEFEGLMADLPTWGDHCPIKAAGWRGVRYRKG